MNWYIKVLKKYADFNGRASRVEFWYFTIINLVVFALYEILAVAVVQKFVTSIFGLTESGEIGNPEFTGIGLAIGGLVVRLIIGVYILAILVPWLAVTIRRLQDTGRSGLYCLLLMIPVFGLIVLIVFLCEDSQPMTNQYGPNPNDMSLNV